jgi:1-acyl-sn-glycerol-3-phosphate acyltransferase
MSVTLRAWLRLLRTALHLLHGTLVVALLFPRIDETARLAHRSRWSRRLLGILGVTPAPVLPASPRGLLVANHISFLDIFVINAAHPAAFVSKSEVRTWPVIGWISARTDTVFLERGLRSAAQRTRARVAAHLRAGKLVAIFPEGTTTEGDRVLPFHAALFQAAIDAGAPITPIALGYADRSGKPTNVPAYVGDMTLLQCLWRIARSEGLVARIEVLPALAADGQERRHLAARAHRLVAHAISPSRTAPPDADSRAGTPAGPRA